MPAAVGLRGHAGHFVELLDEVALGGIGELVRDIHLGIIGVLQQSLRHFDLLRADVVADGDPQLPLEDPGEVGGRDLDGPRHVLHGDPLKDVGVDVVDRLGRLAGRGAQLLPRQHPFGEVQHEPVEKLLDAGPGGEPVHLLDVGAAEVVGLLHGQAVLDAGAGEHEGDLDEMIFQIHHGIVGQRFPADQLREGVAVKDPPDLADGPLRDVAAEHPLRAGIAINAVSAAVVRNGFQPVSVGLHHAPPPFLLPVYKACISFL